MSGPYKISGLGIICYRREDGSGTVSGRNTGGYAASSFDGYGKTGLKPGCVVVHHQREVKGIDFFSGHGKADKSSTVFCHEINGFGCDRFRSHCKVALIFSIFIINENNHPSGPYFLNGIFNAYQWHY